MVRDRLIHWLGKWRRRKCAESLIASLFAFAGGCLALAATFGLVYFGILIGATGVSALTDLLWGKKFAVPHAWRLVLSLGFLVLLFFHTVRARGAEPEPLEDEDFPWGRGRPWPMRSGVLAGELFVISHPMKTAIWITYWLGFGPMCVIGSWRQYLLARHVSKIPLENLAPVLELMLAKMSSVTKDELLAAFPELPWPETAKDLLLIDGVLALKMGEARLTLSEELRGELRAAVALGAANG